jgi:hypothetical protein
VTEKIAEFIITTWYSAVPREVIDIAKLQEKEEQQWEEK